MTRIDRYKSKQNRIKKEKGLKLSFSIFKFLFKLALLLTCIILYSMFIATTGLNIKEYKINHKTIPISFNGFKIIQISDIHYGTSINKKELKQYINKINKLEPDLLIFTGDLIDSSYNPSTKEIKNITKELSSLTSTVGKYAVKGNQDYINSNEIILKNSNFTVLNNSYEEIYYKGYTPIILNGINSNIQNDTNIKESFNYNKDLYSITIFHESDLIDDILKDNSPNLALAGNSLGGLIRIPYVGGLIKTNGSYKYNNSYYKINNTKFYVSSGLGTTKYRFRLFNKPSINLFRLENKNN